MKSSKPFNLANYLADRAAKRPAKLKRDTILIQIARARDCGICQVCGVFSPDTEGHHVHPLFLGGRDELNNIITLCHQCHEKAPMNEHDFLAYQRDGGPMWEFAWNQAVKFLATESCGEYMNPKTAFKCLRDVRDSIFGCAMQPHLADEIGFIPDLRAYHAKVSRARRRFYGEPLPDIEEFMLPHSIVELYT
ncbi:MAG TPA: HNH endonuclease [Bryobacteraceae bacterium]|nr:HNH endonuclease [Bryobacteraceae bacterium]